MRLVPTTVLVNEAKCWVGTPTSLLCHPGKATSQLWCYLCGWGLPSAWNVLLSSTHRQPWVPDTYCPGSPARRQHDIAQLPSAACSLRGRGRLKYLVILQGFSLHQDRCCLVQEEEVTAACHKTHVYHASSSRNKALLSNVFHIKKCFLCRLAEYELRKMCGSQWSQLSNPASAVTRAH